MKILHILSQMPDFTGSGKTIQAIIKQAGDRGHENFLIAGIQDGFELDPSLIPPDHACFVRFNGIDLEFPLPGMSDVMPYPSTVFSSMGLDRLKAYEAAFKRVIQEARDRFAPDIIHSHHLWIVSKIARKVFGDRPMVTSCHGTCLRQFSLCPETDPRMGDAIREIDAIFCLSRHQKDQIRAVHRVAPEKLHLVGGGFDNELFFSAPKPDKGPVEIVYAGKLSRAKGVPWLLASLKKIFAQNFRLHLAGSGSGREEKECLDLARSLGERVIVHGPLPHHELARLMRKSHIFVLPSFFEGLPLVLMEALSSGCRILTTALPGTREILGSVRSDMVDLLELPPLETVDTPFQKDIPLLEQALAEALENSIQKTLKKRQPDMARAREITKAYTWEKVFSRMESVYEKVKR
ncbi:glycosyltransferase family 4 protein [Desulfospira joergensenii]|uniref:glycosyltransferase family 4 protein n=1 Tax=Desulfospira joergensenii TaxID=53329 RepID=UPI0003B7797E|nr:glycosyltransferase family 4 protein [Desulfospira joergensenii]